MKIRDVFDRSVLIYNKAQDIIKKMSKDVSSEIKKSNLKIKDTAVLFDIVLQYSLIQVAISDSDFNINEMIFISKLTKRGDLLKFLKATKKIDITWDDLYRCSIEGIKNYLSLVEEDMTSFGKSFVRIFSEYQRTCNNSYLSDLKSQVILIIKSLSYMDGDPSSEDFNVPILFLRLFEEIENSSEM